MSCIIFDVLFWDYFEHKEKLNLNEYSDEIQESTYINLLNDYASVQVAFSKFTGIAVKEYEYAHRQIRLSVDGVCEESKIKLFCERYDGAIISEVGRFVFGLRLGYPSWRALLK